MDKMTPEALLQKQLDLVGLMSRTIDNLKKSVPKAMMSEGAINTRISILEKHWSEFQKNHDVIMYQKRDTFKDCEYVTKRFSETAEETYAQQRTVLADMLLDCTEEVRQTRDSSSRELSRAGPASGSAALPRIQFPQFSGNYVEWPSFKDLFMSIIRKHSGLSDVDRLHYLKTSLQGPAADLVKDLPTTDENYERTWDILQNHYENKRILVNSCLDKFAALPKMRERSVKVMSELQNGITKIANTLEGMGRPLDQSEDWCVYSIVNLFDPVTRDKWAEKITPSREPPTFTTLKEFMCNQLHQLEVTQGPVSKGFSTSHASKTNESNRSSFKDSASRSQPRIANSNLAQKSGKKRSSCTLCSKDHSLMHCSEYKGLSGTDRREKVHSLRLCLNCLGQHASKECPSTRGCYLCGEKHHTSLHEAFGNSGASKRLAHHVRDCSKPIGKVLLATAVVHVSDSHGRRHAVRALIDQGSEISMMSEGLAQRLRLQRLSSPVDIFGVGGQLLARARGRVTLNVSSSKGDDTIRVAAIVLPKLTAYTHGCGTAHQSWSHMRGLELADPHPDRTTPVEILLGADIYPAIIRDGVRKGTDMEPVGQLTMFGWILTGMTGPVADSMHAQVHQAITGDALSSLVRRFWEQEDIADTALPWTEEEQECETHFVTTHTRTAEGRYQVRLPLRKSGPPSFDCRNGAMQSLKRMEQRFQRDEHFKELYCDFVKQYAELGHMTLAAPPMAKAHYLPHHGVLKPSSSTTKLRVVFNGSWSEGEQPTLNDCLHIGPNLLPLLADVLLRWRRHRYVVTADVTKMYRQILVHPDDRDLQRILWRETPMEHVREYRLNTVTYGLSCAPYLAVRTLRQLAEDEGSRFPTGALALKQDAYVDDILTGANSIPGLVEVATQLHSLCRAGGFPLQKWASNVVDLNKLIPQEMQNAMDLPTNTQESHKTWTDSTHTALGLHWAPHDDNFRFTITENADKYPTKRGVVSKAAQLFDPLGWLTPVTVRAKITIQSTWLLGLGWDDSLPAPLAEEWREFCKELRHLEQIRVPRPISDDPQRQRREIHGFADASERAYGAVLYLRIKDKEGNWSTTLLTAKSKVAPLQQVSLPRLELCAAHLLARLTQRTTTTLNIDDAAVHLWSDSTVALSWIQAHPSKWKTYVANRVADIQRRVPEAQWHHIAGVDNPADCASRGLSPSQLLDFTLWWKGPDFLLRDALLASSIPVMQDNIPEERRPMVTVANTMQGQEKDNDLLKRFSTLNKLLRVSAWCRRWLRVRRNTARLSVAESGSLSVAEIDEAETCWLRIVQNQSYNKEIGQLYEGKGTSNRSTLSPLVPILDDKGLLRVGGRLSQASLNPDEVHPLILPPESHYTQLLIVHSHKRVMHGGVQATLGVIRQRYWIPKGRAAVKGVIHRCVTCARWRAAPAQQLMGDLPRHRVTPTRPFHCSGVDYAGPIWLRTSPGRGHKAYKGFLAVFICMVTRAVHLEVVSDYSAKAFLAAFRRFVSRRGLCAHLHSDCGTTFEGADNELRRLFTASTKENGYLRSQMSDMRTQWHFNPPAAPHFGGLWEAAVKSTKFHLRRTIGEARLTFEEMTTLLAQVEACLNSRPLAPLSDDPADLTALTPGHFLVGSALNALPEPSLLEEQENRLTRWQLVTKMRDQFWLRWQREYLQGLTMRPKWRAVRENIKPGQLCLVVGDSLPPSQWPLARVKEVHPGADNKVRVVKVITATSELVRPVHKLVVLPINDEHEQ